MRDLGVDVQILHSGYRGPETQGCHSAIKIQVSLSMNYCNSARNSVFNPLDVRLRI